VSSQTEIRKASLEGFFGAPPDKISAISVMLWESNPEREWLRNRPMTTQYPRYSPAECEHLIPLDIRGTFRERLDASAERVEFIVETLYGQWHFNTKGFSFENFVDAAHFRMRF
jgi:hypothetical protein